MATPTSDSAGPAVVSPRGRRPNPRIAQMRRTFYFLSRNSLAMVGLAILIFFAVVLLYSFFDPAPSGVMPSYCGSYGGINGAPIPPGGGTGCIPVCTYSSSNTSAQPTSCYAVDQYTPGFVAPTVSVQPLQVGPLPLGSLAYAADSQYFYNIAAGEIKGSQWSIGIALAIVGSGAAVGLVLGSVAGYKGGTTDEVIMRLTDIFLSIPGILLVLVLVATLSQFPWFGNTTSRILVLIGAFVVTWWPFYTRIVRGQVLVTREQKYVEAARASGAGTTHLVFRHIMPNSLYPVFVQLALDVGTIPLLLGTLVFLGFPIFPSQFFTEWGSLAANAVLVLPGAINYCNSVPACPFPWWQILFPGLVIFLFAIAVNFLSDGLRDALDPRLKR